MDELPIEQSCSQPVNPSHVTINGLAHYYTHNASVNNSKVMHTHQFFTWNLDHTLQRVHNSTWTTHTAENTTLLDYKKLYTYVQHCNRILLVQYSIHIFNK